MQQKLEDKRWWNLHHEEKSRLGSMYWMTPRQLCAPWRQHVFTWYGKLATQTSKKGRSVFSTSPTNIWSLVCIGLLTNTKCFLSDCSFHSSQTAVKAAAGSTYVHCTLFWSSATNLQSNSQATTCKKQADKKIFSVTNDHNAQITGEASWLACWFQWILLQHSTQTCCCFFVFC